jgi:phospholipid/cholesterol/gamma-HCH transport system ATP-binding protein
MVRENDSEQPVDGSENGREVLRVEGLTKAFGEKVVLDDVHLTVQSREHLAVLGRSGTGKSVLLKIITGLLEPDRGQVYLWGQPICGLSERDWLPLRRRMGLVFQSGALFDSMTVFENVAFPLRELKMESEAEIRRIVEERLEWVGLSQTGGQAPSELSGGMRRRVALARTLAGDPEFILFDEPTAGLDPVTGRKISHLMRDLDKRLKSTSVVVTHDIDCARTVSGRWAFLSHGRVLAQGAPKELLESGDPEVREFLLPGGVAQNLPEES